MGNANAFRPPNKGSGPPNRALSFRRADVKGLQNMENYLWRVVDDQSVADDTTAVVVSDYLAAANDYRIVTKILARPPLVVRASFHDYRCEQYEQSHGYFSALLSSVELL